MNLIKDKWLPVARKNSRPGEFENIAIWQILENYSDNPVVEIIAPRPDFRNALYQLLIGIVQVAALPEDDEHWSELYNTPWDSEEFKKKVLSFEHCFEIDSEGPAFMQDFDLKEGYKEETLGNLFINLPANEHFTPTNEQAAKTEPKQINPYWAAVALFTLQTFAPSGGRGHRVGLRGGGPLTTILLPKKHEA
ncbi:MAG: type I-E CRISPR-associated protein Cse1/CasA, partial [Chitinispirillaceae bacterium]